MENTLQTEHKEPKQIVLTLDKTRYTINLVFNEKSTETYKDKVLKLLQRDIENEK